MARGEEEMRAVLKTIGPVSALTFRVQPLISSSLFLGGLLASTAFGLYPYVLPANTDPGRGPTVFNSAAADHGLRVALWWWVPGMLLVLGYLVFFYRNFAGKVHVEGTADRLVRDSTDPGGAGDRPSPPS